MIGDMAARSDASATPGPKVGAFMSFNVVSSSSNSLILPKSNPKTTLKHIYDCQSLFDISSTHKHQLSPEAIEKL